jgi:hypothetical protein
MASSFTAEEALAWAMKAAEAVEEAGKSFGPMSEESRLARAAFEHLMDDYREHWSNACESRFGHQGCKEYDV